MRSIALSSLASTLMLISCTSPETEKANHDNSSLMDLHRIFLETGLPYHTLPFDRLNPELLRDGIEQGMVEHRTEVDAITGDPGAPTFANTIEALERSGQLLGRASGALYNLNSSHTNEALQALRSELAPKLAAHRDAINLDPKLFARIRTLHEQRGTLGLDASASRLLDRYYTDMVRGGALLGPEDKKRLMALNEEESRLTTKFQDMLLAETNASAVVIDDPVQLDGMTPEEMQAAADAAREKGMEGKWLITLVNTTQQPVLAVLKDRATREKVYKASIARGSRGGEHDNSELILRLAALRAEKAALFGFPDHASYVLDDQMARTPAAALKLLTGMVPAATTNARQEAAKLQAMMDKDIPGARLEPWDHAYYAEQVRKAEYALDEAAIKPYFALERVLNDGVFHAAGELYGLTFEPRTDVPVYHKDVRVWEIIGPDGKGMGYFYGDFYARESKQGGAWMSSFVDQSGLLDHAPVIVNNCNYPAPVGDAPCLLSWDNVNTLFHEFGHALHGMLSQVRYPYFSGTATPRDFVEFPSQFNENWALQPAIVANYARHHATGDPMPAELVERLRRSSTFDQGYATTEYLAAALLDLEWHSLPAGTKVDDVVAFEKAALEKHGILMGEVPPRYKSNYFSHIWGGGYSAGYYAYLWSEVLEADAYAWFEANGGMTRENGERMRLAVLSKGGSVEADTMFHELTGRGPRVEPLLKKRGLDKALSSAPLRQ